MQINEIKSIASYDPITNPNGYLDQSYEIASGLRQPGAGERPYTNMDSITGMPANEVYTNGHVISVFIMAGKDQPIFLLNLTHLAKGYSTTNVVAHSQHSGKGFAVPTYLAVSRQFNKPLYSFGTQTPAGQKIWQTLAQKYPDRVKGINVKTNELIPFDKLIDNDFATRAILLPESQVQENFADGKKKGKSRPGRVKKSGASCKGSVTDLRAKAKKYSGERGKMYHWCANMKGGKKK